MIRNVLRHLFRPHCAPPLPEVRLSTVEERDEVAEKTQEIIARMERLRLEAERHALRRMAER